MQSQVCLKERTKGRSEYKRVDGHVTVDTEMVGMQPEAKEHGRL